MFSNLAKYQAGWFMLKLGSFLGKTNHSMSDITIRPSAEEVLLRTLVLRWMHTSMGFDLVCFDLLSGLNEKFGALPFDISKMIL